MPFTLLLLRVGFYSAIFLLAGAALRLDGLASLAECVVILTMLAGLPMLLLESLGPFNRAASIFFGRRR